ncbi:MAG: TRAP transporter large permease subunit, partial [Planctomycetota bacterium]
MTRPSLPNRATGGSTAVLWRSRRGAGVVLLALVALVAACGPATKQKLEAVAVADGPVIESLEGPGGQRGGAPSGGDLVTIKGKNFPAQVDCAVRFGDKRNKEKDLEKATPTEIVVRVPEKLPPGEVLDVSVEKRDEDDKVVARAVLKDAWSVSGYSARHMVIAGCLIGIFSILGGPIFVVLAAITLLGTFFEKQGLEGTHLIEYAGSSVFGAFFDKVAESPLFIAIPLFTFAGTIMAESKTPQRLVDFARALFGWVPGGVALVALVTCSFFTAFTGASGVTIIALGGLLYPVLRKDNYDERFTLGLLTTCGSLGLLFKPALPVYIYGIIAKIDADRV